MKSSVDSEITENFQIGHYIIIEKFNSTVCSFYILQICLIFNMLNKVYIKWRNNIKRHTLVFPILVRQKVGVYPNVCAVINVYFLVFSFWGISYFWFFFSQFWTDLLSINMEACIRQQAININGNDFSILSIYHRILKAVAERFW